jgi:hypothetical protein
MAKLWLSSIQNQGLDCNSWNRQGAMGKFLRFSTIRNYFCMRKAVDQVYRFIDLRWRRSGERWTRWSLSSWPTLGVGPRRDGLGSTKGTSGSLPRAKGGSSVVELTGWRRCPPVECGEGVGAFYTARATGKWIVCGEIWRPASSGLRPFLKR